MIGRCQEIGVFILNDAVLMVDYKKFTPRKYENGIVLNFDFNLRIVTGHNKKVFDSYGSLITFLKKNPTKNIYITLDQTDDLLEDGDNLVTNLHKYQDFCGNLGKNGENRAQAFFARRVKHFSEDEKKEMVANSTDKEILGWIKNLDEEGKKRFSEMLKDIDGIEVVKFSTKEESEKITFLLDLIRKEGLTEEHIKKVLSDARKDVLTDFRRLLEEESYWEDYYEKYQDSIKSTGEEAVFHYFLKENDWILGLNVDIKFIKDFTDEVSVGNPDTDNSGNPKTDMMGLSDYTTLIEFKTPSTNFFTAKKSSKSRAGTWSFSEDFIEGVSQCLAQKSGWDKNHKSKNLVLDKKVQDQDETRTVDPKAIFIIGNKQRELNIRNKETENITKRDTLERFCRNNKNVEIISYDELYERAYYIIYNEKPELLNIKKENDQNIDQKQNLTICK